MKFFNKKDTKKKETVKLPMSRKTKSAVSMVENVFIKSFHLKDAKYVFRLLCPIVPAINAAVSRKITDPI